MKENEKWMRICPGCKRMWRHYEHWYHFNKMKECHNGCSDSDGHILVPSGCLWICSKEEEEVQ